MQARDQIHKEIGKGNTCSIVTLLDAILNDAHEREASDIHIDPTKDAFVVRLRIDGCLSDTYPLPLSCHTEIISRIKILANLRTDEHSTPQDGRFVVSENAAEEYSIRVSILPTQYGENVVLRLLSHNGRELSLRELGMDSHQQEVVTRALQHPHGLILVTGPTGSGKTTTLYSLMRMLSGTDTSLVSIEDPVEYSMEGVTQIQIRPNSGLTFAHGLRSILRQDPDVLMVGEIRDTETAQLAAQAALTGHLVLATLHTNDAQSAATRLHDMGVPAYIVSSVLRCVIAQRLLRRLCNECKCEQSISEEDWGKLTSFEINLKNIPVLHLVAHGCDVCGGKGYQGRTGTFEVLLFSSSGKLHPTQSLLENALEKVRDGQLSLQELYRVHYA